MPGLADRGAAGNHVGRLVRAPKTAELIAGLYRRQIVRGELRPGDALPPEQQLMTQFGVSRPTLREAFRVLEAENLISVKRGSRGGARVTQPSLSVAARYVGLLLQVQGTTIADVYQARMVLEPACARLLARHRTGQDLADLGGCVEELRGLIEAEADQAPQPGRWSGPGELSRRFHQLIVQRCGSKTLAAAGEVLQDIVETHLTLAVTRASGETGALEHDVRGYARLVTLVERRDGGAAERHWRSHMEAAGQRLLGEDSPGGPVVDLFS